jgi:hypothetical protein
MIRLQNAGGLGNQLFVWAAAHNLAHKFDEKVVIFTVKDLNSRKDRPSELQRLKMYCKHDVYLRESFVLGYILRVVDKLKFLDFIVSTGLQMSTTSVEGHLRLLGVTFKGMNMWIRPGSLFLERLSLAWKKSKFRSA